MQLSRLGRTGWACHVFKVQLPSGETVPALVRACRGLGMPSSSLPLCTEAATSLQKGATALSSLNEGHSLQLLRHHTDPWALHGVRAGCRGARCT